jgi:hypothetical protein
MQWMMRSSTVSGAVAMIVSAAFLLPLFQRCHATAPRL